LAKEVYFQKNLLIEDFAQAAARGHADAGPSLKHRVVSGQKLDY